MLLDLWPLLEDEEAEPPPPVVVVGGGGGVSRTAPAPYVPPRKRIRIRWGPKRIEAVDSLQIGYRASGVGRVDGVGSTGIRYTARASIHVQAKELSKTMTAMRIGSAGLIDSTDLELLLVAAVFLDEESNES